MSSCAPDNAASPTPWQIFVAFLALGCTAFGGPVAHIGYYRAEFVDRRRWIDAQQYQDLVALCQFLPGPASTQTAMGIGMLHARFLGGLAAWAGFTLPSALLMIALGLGGADLNTLLEGRLVHGLKLAAVAIVAVALWQMGRTACTDATRLAFAGAATAIMLFTDIVWIQIAVIAAAALAGRLLLKAEVPEGAGAGVTVFGRRTALAAALLLAGALVALPLAAALSGSGLIAVVSTFFRAGALVFGGGHVVLPLLEAEVVQPGWVSADDFLAGYGAAQAIPGPLFTFAAYLGAVMGPLGASLFGAALALAMIFLPGMLLLVAVLPHWNRFRRWDSAQALMRGANAAVVGILGAALYQPVWTSAILGPREFALALTGFLLLAVWKLPAWAVVALLAGGGVLISV